MYRCESWASIRQVINLIRNFEIIFLRQTRGCTRRDCFCDEDIRHELQVLSISDTIQKCILEGLQHLHILKDIWLPKVAYKHIDPLEQGIYEDPRARWRDIL